ncbi:22672_t:CDS:2 [Rhizophagus irregularis]|uniref:Uncharacterized protein n=1 Tax=Rhizophagus irregularis (strain DAOM 181602 / DAOM 197198 / MUCL 43194) TaxID=747089 RepID=U9V809_RHIID|nr:22672_t:CDS:2 [Rhizophagus irregularis]
MLGSFNLEYLKDWHQRIGDPKGEKEREEYFILVMVDNNIGHLVKRVGDL